MGYKRDNYYESVAEGSIYAGKFELEQAKERLEKQRQCQEQICKEVKDWAEFSLNARSEDEIKERILKDNKNGTNTCCISYICKFSKLSEEMIEWLCEYTSLAGSKSKSYRKNKVDWDYISIHQKLSEEFIEKHHKEVNWRFIYQFQDVSEDFKKKHRSDLAFTDKKDYERRLALIQEAISL